MGAIQLIGHLIRINLLHHLILSDLQRNQQYKVQVYAIDSLGGKSQIKHSSRVHFAFNPREKAKKKKNLLSLAYYYKFNILIMCFLQDELRKEHTRKYIQFQRYFSLVLMRFQVRLYDRNCISESARFSGIQLSNIYFVFG